MNLPDGVENPTGGFQTLKAAQDAGAVTLNYGEFFNSCLARMALPVWWQGFRSGSGLEFLLILLSGFCHQGKHLGTSFVSSGFDSAFAMSDSLAAARLLSQIS